MHKQCYLVLFLNVAEVGQPNGRQGQGRVRIRPNWNLEMRWLILGTLTLTRTFFRCAQLLATDLSGSGVQTTVPNDSP